MVNFWGKLFTGGGAPRGEAEALRMTEMRQRAASGGLSILHVIDAYKVLPKGTKAWVIFDGQTEKFDAFFWHTVVQNEQTILASTSSGYGAHSKRDYIQYIGHQGASGVRDVLPAGTHTAAAKYLRKHPVIENCVEPPAPRMKAPRNERLIKSVYPVVPKGGSAWNVIVDGNAISQTFNNFESAVAEADRLRGGSRCWNKFIGKICEGVNGHDGRHINYKDGHSGQRLMRWSTEETL